VKSRSHSRAIGRAFTGAVVITLCTLVPACGRTGVKPLPDSAEQGGSGGTTTVQCQGGTGGQGPFGTCPLGANQCRGNADCDYRHPSCVSPAAGPACSICLDPTVPCTTDGECQGDGGELICEVVACPCSPGARGCIPGCADASECHPGQACAAYHCVSISCQSDADCPTDFECNNGTCERKTCTTDAICSGYCVNGWCYSTPGTCQSPVP
jgi:hypothetical protein